MPVPAPSPSYTSNYQTPAPEVIAPLRGTTVDAASIAHPSLAAKIDDHPAARPQVGLERTDIVFEELVEGGLTRYVAIWQSDIPEEIGPVRSIRPMDPDIISAFGGIVAYSGGQQRFVALMQKTPVFNAIHGQKATADTFYRTKSKAAPHNVIVKASILVGQHPDLAPPAQQFAYSLDLASSTGAKDGAPTAALNFVFSQATKPSWTYDAAIPGYLRAQLGVADLDSNGAQLHATNVVALRVGIDTSLGVPKTKLIGSGEAWISSGGGTVHGSWSKGSPTSPIRLTDDNGVVVRLAPGNTWIELVPLAGSVTIVAP
jgi:Protein of unknown function (DUF3048) N-terminal domain/Protein of unknown function (DUF3048) C-terminal domain